MSGGDKTHLTTGSGQDLKTRKEPLMKTYYINLYNGKREIYVSYHITAESKQEAVTRAINDQLATTPRYQIEVVEVRAD